MTNKVPFPHLNSEGMITLTVIEGEVPSPRQDTQLAQIVALCSMMTDCWAFDPNARPSISRCSNELGWMVSSALGMIQSEISNAVVVPAVNAPFWVQNALYRPLATNG